MLDGCIKYAIRLPSSQKWLHRTLQDKQVKINSPQTTCGNLSRELRYKQCDAGWHRPTDGNTWQLHINVIHYISTHTARDPVCAGQHHGLDAACAHAWVTSHELSQPNDWCVRPHICGALYIMWRPHWLVSYASAMFHWITCTDVCGLFRTSCAAHRATCDFSSIKKKKQDRKAFDCSGSAAVEVRCLWMVVCVCWRMLKVVLMVFFFLRAHSCTLHSVWLSWGSLKWCLVASGGRWSCNVATNNIFRQERDRWRS